jgi:hypothetical protein
VSNAKGKYHTTEECNLAARLKSRMMCDDEDELNAVAAFADEGGFDVLEESEDGNKNNDNASDSTPTLPVTQLQQQQQSTKNLHQQQQHKENQKLGALLNIPEHYHLQNKQQQQM